MSEINTRPIKGYEGLYCVTSEGDVISETTHKMLKPSQLKSGYLRVKLYKQSKPKMFMVHRLVADAFLSHEKSRDQVNHKDGDKKNNSLSNLEWVTQSENQIHAFQNNLNSTESAVNASKRKVVQLSMDGAVIKVWDSLSDATRSLGIATANITHCCRGRIRHAGGYKWKYLDC